MTGNWYGHPEHDVVEKLYHEAVMSKRSGFGKDDWGCYLICWYLLDENGDLVGRAYMPTEATPRWVYTDARGDNEVEPQVTMEHLRVMIVEYRLKGGKDVDALHLQA